MSKEGKKEPAGKAAAKAPAAAKSGKAAPKGGKSSSGKAASTKPSWRVNFPLYERRVKNYRLGNDIRPRGIDLTHFIKWPKYVRIQRQKKILQDRLKVPPAIAQFNRPLKREHAIPLFKLLHKYRPESSLEKKKRLTKLAEAKAKGESLDTIKRPQSVVAGVNHVTSLIESDRAKLVVIAHNVDPVEVVMWLPTLCRKKDIPYCIVKDKSRLGRLIHRKNCAVLALTEPRKEDNKALADLVTVVREKFNDNEFARKHWGGGRLGPKAHARILKEKKLIAKEEKLRSKAAAAAK